MLMVVRGMHGIRRRRLLGRVDWADYSMGEEEQGQGVWFSRSSSGYFGTMVHYGASHYETRSMMRCPTEVLGELMVVVGSLI